MITAGELYTYLNGFAPFETAMDFDNAGLLIGSEQQQSDAVLAALDATAAVLQEAHEKNIRIVLTHHPVIFRPIKNLLSDSIPYLAASLGITVISAHTNLDIAPGGVNDTLAECIGIREEERFDTDCALIGCCRQPLSCKDMALHIKSALSVQGLRYTDNGRMLHRIMVSCGAGGSSVGLAKSCGADALITGEIKHHEILFANNHGIAVFDLGHFNSEDMIIPKLCGTLSKQFPDTAFIQADADTDGVHYI